MNIIILEDSSKAKFGGGQRITIDVIKVLKDKYQIILFDTLIDSFFAEELLKLNVKPNKLKLIVSNKSSVLFSLIKFFNLINELIQNISTLRKYLNANSLDKYNSIIYSTTKRGLLIAYLMNLFFKIKFIYHEHLIENLFYKDFVRILAKRAFRVICVSSIVSKQLNLKNKVVINNSIDHVNSRAKSIENKSPIIVASVSTLNRIKGIKYFIESFSFLKNSNVVYHIYGDGDEINKMKNMSNENIQFKGYNSDINNVFSAKVDLLVVPTIIPESFAMVILEAFSKGIPVVTTNIGMQKEHAVNSRAGEIVEIKNAKQIAQKIEHILSENSIFQGYSKCALEYANGFVKNQFCADIFKLFEQLEVDITRPSL